MKHALIDSGNGRIAQLADYGSAFAVAPPFFWVDVADDIDPSRVHWDGTAIVGWLAPSPPVAAQTETAGSPQFLVTTQASRGACTATLYLLAKGQKIPMHRHDFAHASHCLSGLAEVERDGVTERLDIGAFVDFPAGQAHEVRAVSDVVLVNLRFSVPAQGAVDD